MKIVRKLYDWVLHWADTPYAEPALFFIAIIESSFFPVPPDTLLIVLTIARPQLWARYAAVCTAGSVIGGIGGYGIGVFLMDIVGHRILDLYGVTARFEQVGALYREYDAWAVIVAGFTPIPYKVFTIAAGTFDINFAVFVFASIIGRGGRFFLVAFLLRRYGAGVKDFIDKYFNILTLVFMALLIGGFVLVKFLL